MRRALPLLLLLGAVLGAAGASAETLGGTDLVRELSDKTLTGFNGSLWFSEYHAPDGRVYGYNAGVPNQDACWKVRGDAVCYYYPRNRRDEREGTVEYCWHLERAGDQGFRITPVDRTVGGIARSEAGNPHDYSAQGREWTCEPLISRLRPRRPAAPADGREFAAR